jgi:hypothetical protein
MKTIKTRLAVTALLASVTVMVTAGARTSRAADPKAPPATTTSAKPAAQAALPGAPPASVPGAPPGQPGAAAADAAPKVKVERGAGGKKVYRITEEIRIEGKIQKPEAFFFYQKSSINYDWQELKQDFVPKILESVSRAPF